MVLQCARMYSCRMRQHLAPAAVMIGCLALVAWKTVTVSIWVAGGAGAIFILVWAWVRLETGIWPHSFDDIQFGIKPESLRKED